MPRPRCFIVQEPMKKDMVSGMMVPMLDFRKVVEYGDPVVLVTTSRIGFTPGPLFDTIRDKMRDITDEDFIVPTGDPVAMFAVAMVAADLCNGKVNCLKWDKTRSEYIAIRMDSHYRTRKGELE